MPLLLFALERYDTGGGAPVPLPDLPLTGVSQLVWMVRLPDDDVLLAIVEGTDAESVAGAMATAGWRVDRITPASWVCPPLGAATHHLSPPDPEVLP